MPRVKTIRSPKGLIGITTIRGFESPIFGPIEFDPAHFSSEQLEPNKWALKPKFDNRQAVDDLIAFWRRFAAEIIRREGEDPERYRLLARESNVLDRNRAAARLLIQLDRLSLRLRRMEPADKDAWTAMHEALLVASYVHQLTIVDNERGIVQREGQDKKISEINENARSRQAQLRREVARIQNTRKRPKPFNNTELATKVKETTGSVYSVGFIRKLIAQK